jgi:transposase
MGNAQAVGERPVEETQAAVRLRRPERLQWAMVMQCPDDLVGPDHRVRLLEAVVGKPDVGDFCQPIKARAGEAGRDASDPRLLVGLWRYAYLRGMGSAREVAQQCDPQEGSAAFRWLCGGVTVNHRLLSDFRTDHGAALDRWLTQVIASLVDKNVVQVSRISQDGMRVRVGAGASSYRREERLEKLLEEAQQHVEAVRQQGESAEGAPLSGRQKGARKRRMRRRG